MVPGDGDRRWAFPRGRLKALVTVAGLYEARLMAPTTGAVLRSAAQGFVVGLLAEPVDSAADGRNLLSSSVIAANGTCPSRRMDLQTSA